jgi:hypothetical protein
MPRLAVFAFLTALPTAALALTTETDRGPQPIDHLPIPVAEPENPTSYERPHLNEDEGPSGADSGPAQKHFVIASQLDNLVGNPNAPITNTVPSEKISLDKKIKIPLVHDVQDDNTFKGGHNPSISFEISYLNWGAVTHEQLRARQGHYFTITFVNNGPKDDFVTRLEYRQVKSKQVVRSLMQQHARVSGAARAYFAVVDKAYLFYGPISSWRFTVLRGDTVVAEAKSYLW